MNNFFSKWTIILLGQPTFPITSYKETFLWRIKGALRIGSYRTAPSDIWLSPQDTSTVKIGSSNSCHISYLNNLEWDYLSLALQDKCVISVKFIQFQERENCVSFVGSLLLSNTKFLNSLLPIFCDTISGNCIELTVQGEIETKTKWEIILKTSGISDFPRRVLGLLQC